MLIYATSLARFTTDLSEIKIDMHRLADLI
jgi:hypothetical protein